MNGPQHYKEAERIADRVDRGEYPAEAAMLAQVHATLALAAATALPALKRYYGDDSDTDRDWAGVAS